jgi:hypothetical protein
LGAGEGVETEKVVACKVPVVTRVPFRVERIRVETERVVAARVVRVAVEAIVDAVVSCSTRVRVEPAKVEARSGEVLRVLRLAAVVVREENGEGRDDGAKGWKGGSGDG